MKEKDANLLFLGIFNAISVIPVLFLAMVVALAMLALTGKKMNVLIDIIFLLISFLSPISCIVGIVQGIRNRKNSRIYGALACVKLSIIGILLFAVVSGFLWWRISIP